MAMTQQITCDSCGKQKQLTNHWFMATTTQYSGFFVHEWNIDLMDVRKHYCGQECTVKALSEWMQKGKG